MLSLYLLTTASAYAIDYQFEKAFQSNGLYYRVDKTNNCASVTDECYSATSVGKPSYSNLTGVVNIQQQVLYEGVYYPVRVIGSNAFRNCDQITSVNIPSSVTDIMASAFRNSGISGSLNIPSAVTSIGAYAFAGCEKLSGEITLPSKLTEISDGVFENCSNITSVNIPASVTSIGEYAFENCNNLACDIELPSTLNEIKREAFENCSSITGTITIPASCTTIGEMAFCGIGATAINVDQGNTNYSSVDGVLYSKSKDMLIACPAGKMSDSFSIESGVSSISQYALYNCKNLKGTLTIPAKVTSIPMFTFYGCSGFTGPLIIHDNIKTISYSAFEGCSGFTSLQLSSAYTRIVDNTFKDCTGMKGKLTIPDNVKYIGVDAFYNCSGFTSIELSSSITAIGDRAFCNCSGLTGKLIISNYISEFGSNAFDSCSGLEYVILKEAFTGTKILHASGFQFNNTTAKIIVPNFMGHIFRTDTSCCWYWGADRLYDFGDVDLNQHLRVTDAVIASNYIIGIPTENIDLVCADVNYDGEITIKDVTEIIRGALYTNPNDMFTDFSPEKTVGNNRLAIDDFSISEGNAVTNLSLNGCENTVAFQADLFGEDGLYIENAVLSPELTATHNLSTARLENGALRVIIFSLANNMIAPDMPMLSLAVSGKSGRINANSCFAATAEGEELFLGVSGGLGTTGVGSVNAGEGYVISDAGGITVCNASGSKVGIFNLAGQMVCNFTAVSDFETIPLPQGIYIVRINNNSHKIIVK